MNEQILQEISEFCRVRRACRDRLSADVPSTTANWQSRLRNGGRITTDTLERIRAFMARNSDGAPARRRVLFEPTASGVLPVAKPAAPPVASGLATDDPQRNFRFFDNRQKYLLFVNTCSEKWVVASRVGLELGNIHPRPPAVRVFDAGVGDGTVLARVMRSMHDRFPTTPFYIVGKEISLEDIRLTLHKMADRFVEHPSDGAGADQSCLRGGTLAGGEIIERRHRAWSGKRLAMAGNTAHSFETQITDLEPFLVRELEGAGEREDAATRSTSVR